MSLDWLNATSIKLEIFSGKRLSWVIRAEIRLIIFRVEKCLQKLPLACLAQLKKWFMVKICDIGGYCASPLVQKAFQIVFTRSLVKYICQQ